MSKISQKIYVCINKMRPFNRLDLGPHSVYLAWTINIQHTHVQTTDTHLQRKYVRSFKRQMQYTMN